MDQNIEETLQTYISPYGATHFLLYLAREPFVTEQI